MITMSEAEFARRFLSGQELFGDDFDAEGIRAWFADEQHAYADLAGSDRQRHSYGYDALNRQHGFAHLPAERTFSHVLGFGSNFGDELDPVLARCDRITLLDSSGRFEVDNLKGVPVSYLLADPSGRIALPDGSVDLLTCFGVLHHIPNVSAVIGEFARVLRPGGYALIREPVTTLGDWRKPRIGLTPRERGIPRAMLLRMIDAAGLNPSSVASCDFRPWVRLCLKLGIPTFGRALPTRLDALLSAAFLCNSQYHRTTFWSRFAPASVFVVAVRE